MGHERDSPLDRRHPERGLRVLRSHPVAISFAILKYRLYEIDVIINRPLVYGILTAVLGAVYSLGTLGIGGLLQAVSRRGSNSLVVVATTLAVAALSRPARGRIQAFIDRRFYRKKYEASRTLEDFSTRLRQMVDLESLRASSSMS